MSRQGGIAVAVVCAACGGQVVQPPSGAGGSTAIDAGKVVVGAGGAATATGGAATTTSGAPNASDAGTNVSDADVTAALRAYCAACSQEGDCTNVEHAAGDLPAACRSPLVTFVRCMTAALVCPISPDAVKAPPPGDPSCSTESTAFYDCLSRHMKTAP